MSLAYVKVSNLPCCGPYWSNIIMLQIQSLSLGNLCIPVATSHILNVLQPSTLPSLSWDNSVLVILPISQPLVDTWIAHSHDVVQRATGQYNRGNCLCILTHGAKGILHHPSGIRESVVKYRLLIRKSSGTKRLHQPGLQGEGIIPNEKVWQITVTEDLGIRTGPIGANIHPQELVLGIQQSQKYYGMEALVVVIE